MYDTFLPVLTSSLACSREDITVTCDVTGAGRLTWVIGSEANTIVFSLTESSSSLSTTRYDSTGQFTASLTRYSRDDQTIFLGNLTSILSVHNATAISDFPMISCQDGINIASSINVTNAGIPFNYMHAALYMTFGVLVCIHLCIMLTCTHDCDVSYIL